LYFIINNIIIVNKYPKHRKINSSDDVRETFYLSLWI